MTFLCDQLICHLCRGFKINPIPDRQKDRLDIDMGAQSPPITLPADLNICIRRLCIWRHFKVRACNPVIAFGNSYCGLPKHNARVCCQPHMPWMQIPISIKEEDIGLHCDFFVGFQKERYLPKSQTARYVCDIDFLLMTDFL